MSTAELMHPPWDATPGLCHGFLPGDDGSSGGQWQVSVGGGLLPVSVPRQVHGVRVLPSPRAGARPEADGLVTTTPGHLVGIVTADCVPVLLVDRGRRAAAAVHAGWRGAAAGVLEAALDMLATAAGTRPADVEAALGPAIGGCCYQVGAEVAAAFRGRVGAVTDRAWEERGGRLYVDLRTATRLLLGAAGIDRVAVLGPCTACDRQYHSYRRDGDRAGRQLSYVGWR